MDTAAKRRHSDFRSENILDGDFFQSWSSSSKHILDLNPVRFWLALELEGLKM